ncbi:MAG TPA: PepSY domain-containing protein [Methylomirabilota bacterium]|nr:PepSY domain-containing protein [Methylomirabilota bacterium]
MTITNTIGITLGTLLLATGPALAARTGPPSIIGWTTADAVAAERVPGKILATRLERDGARAEYNVAVHTPDNRLEEVRVDAHTAVILGVHEAHEPGILGEVEAP